MDFTKIANAVEVDHGVKRLSMRYIKQFVTPARERLSPELCEQISKSLDDLGLLTLPRTLPPSENAWVFILSKDSALGQAVTVSTGMFAMAQMGLAPVPDMAQSFPELAEQLGYGLAAGPQSDIES